MVTRLFFKHSMLFLIALLFLFFSIPARAGSQEINIGVVEFEEKNSIGLENAGRIIAEWVVTEIKKIGSFQVQERLLLNKVLEEQKLMLSGIIDESQAGKIGKLYGVDAIVTGSFMKVGDSISITGRMVNVENGEILKTASVETSSLAELQTEIIILTNALCDISRSQWEVKTDIARKSIARLEAGGGISYGWDNVDWGSPGLQIMIRYRDRWGSLWFGGVPLGGILGIEAGGTFMLTNFIGIGLCAGKVFDIMVNSAESTYVNLGLVATPRVDIEAGILFGIAPTGGLWTDEPKLTDFSPYLTLPGNYSVWFEYRIGDNMILQAKYTGTEFKFSQENIPDVYNWNPFGAGTGYLFQTDRLSISALYSFAIE
jgi:TolB-like protein